MICVGCGKDDECRLGFCWDCASSGESRAAKRTVIQHLAKARKNLKKRAWWNAKCDLKWAFQRMTRTGDYAKDGYFDGEGIDWRSTSASSAQGGE